jgi:hypothetical protein
MFLPDEFLEQDVSYMIYENIELNASGIVKMIKSLL